MIAMHTSTVLLLLVAAAAAAAATANSFQVSQPQRVQSAAGQNAAGACVSSEREALLAFKRGITDDPASRLDSWRQGEDCCRWRGVRCSNRTGHVVGLHLRNVQSDNLIEGTALAGHISPSLISLHYLQHLDLSLNNLSGPAGRVPEFLGLLKNLRYLNLSGMPFIGRVPSQLGNLSNLHYLDLSPAAYDNPWLRSLNSTDISWISNLPLRYLNMDSVDLSSVVDWAQVMNMVPSLKVLRLPYCILTSANQSLPRLNLTNLEELDLSSNEFRHTFSSCWLWNLTSLRHLSLSGNNMYGQMPKALGRMTSLQVLDFSHNSVSADMMTTSMRNLCDLESLVLTNIEASGNIIELLPQCSHNKLKELHLGGNSFTGMLPEWIGRQWSSLLILDLNSNQFTGHVPHEIGMLNNLQTLKLSGNHFTGPLPSEIGMLKNLLILDLSNNKFTGPLPLEISKLSNLTGLKLSNSNLSGVITHEHFVGLTSLRMLDLSSNSLKVVVGPEQLPPFRLEYAYFASCQMGPLFPSWLQSQTNILELDISRASIFDKLPDWFVATFSNAELLHMSTNVIHGTLPTDIGNMTILKTLDLSSNKLTGPLPQSICQLEWLDQLNLANNNFDGEFPLCSEPREARILILRQNRLSGNFPLSLETWKNLYILDLAWNMFSGRLPLWIGGSTDLRILQLSHNMFTGSIPSTITKLNTLTQLNLAGNGISGTLPHHLSNLTGMKKEATPTIFPGYTVFVPYNGTFHDEVFGDAYANLPVITKGQERHYMNDALYQMVSIDLSSNQLTGRIPEEITSLDGVINLNLSRNQLSGKIPNKIGNMQSLESLDLSENKIHGEIPQSLSNVIYLSYLDLSYNNLKGRIPSGGQLETLYAQYPFLYNGNSGLCGLLQKKNCSIDSDVPEHGDHERDEYDSKLMSLFFGLGVGFVVGLWVVFCVILFKKSWVIAYFRLFDKAFDEVYVLVFITWSKWAKKNDAH